jgi:CelD/BcsL family acetyltransferase involved in cellulose biosynthesis
VRWEFLKLARLLPQERALWLEGALGNPLASIFLTPQFCEAAERAGLQPRLGIFRDGQGSPLAFLPCQKGVTGWWRPVAAPMNDLQAIVVVKGSLPAASFPHPASFNAWAHDACHFSRAEPEPYALIDLPEGYDAWFHIQRAAHKKAFGNLRNRENRVARDIGEVEFTMDDRDTGVFHWVLEQKSQQMRAAGHPDLFARGWPKRLLCELAGNDPAVRLMVSSLRFDGQLVAAHIGAVAGGVLHHWFPAYAREYHPFAPGHLLLLRMLQAAPACHIHRVDMATGDYPYKEHFATRSVTVYNVAQPLLLASANVMGRAVRKLDRWAMYAGL